MKMRECTCASAKYLLQARSTSSVQFKVVRVATTDTPNLNCSIFEELSPWCSHARMLNFWPSHSPDETGISFCTHILEYAYSSHWVPIKDMTAKYTKYMAPFLDVTNATSIDTSGNNKERQTHAHFSCPCWYLINNQYLQQKSTILRFISDSVVILTLCR